MLRSALLLAFTLTFLVSDAFASSAEPFSIQSVRLARPALQHRLFLGVNARNAERFTHVLHTNVARTLPRFAYGRVVKPFSTVITNDDGGQAGISYAATTSSITLASANQSILPSLLLPSNYVLYAPTTKIPGHGCLEGTTIYGYGATSVGFWDFCIQNNENFYGTETANSTFVSNYVRNFGDGIPAYTVEIAYSTTPASCVTINHQVHCTQGKYSWSGALYNYTDNVWDIFYSNDSAIAQNGSVNGGAGWDMFETHFPAGALCKNFGTFKTSDYSVNGSLVTAPSAGFFSFGDCFNEDSDGNKNSNAPNPYVLDPLTQVNSWIVSGGS